MLLISSLAMLAAKLDPRLANEPDQEKAAKAALTRIASFTTPFLLIYDNMGAQIHCGACCHQLAHGS